MIFLWIAFGLCFLFASAHLLVAISRHVLRINRIADQIHFAKTSDDVRLALHRYCPEKRNFQEPLLLCHGFGVNRFLFDFMSGRSLSRALAKAGFDVWSLELRGHGQSLLGQRTTYKHTFEDHAQKDVPTAVDYICNETQSPNVIMLGHSLGGLLGYVYSAEGNNRMKALVSICSPVRFDRSVGFRYFRWLVWLASSLEVIWLRPLALFIAPFVVKIPKRFVRIFLVPGSLEPNLLRRALANMVENTSSNLLRQMLSWEKSAELLSVDGQIDYIEKLNEIDVPVLIVAAEKDYLAPPESIVGAYEVIPNSDKQLRIFGRDAGDDYDFGHGDIVMGPNASSVVYPEIIDWLKKKANQVDEYEMIVQK